MLKVEEVLTPKLPNNILQTIWQTETTPNDWKVGLIVKLPKKGDLADTNNWRGIMLLSVTSKVLIRIILHRVASVIDPYLRKEQAGFRKGKSCADQIFSLRQILEQSNEWITTVNANFIDFAKTFESVHRPEELLKMLMHYAIPNTIISIIQMLYMDFYEKVI